MMRDHDREKEKRSKRLENVALQDRNRAAQLLRFSIIRKGEAPTHDMGEWIIDEAD